MQIILDDDEILNIYDSLIIAREQKKLVLDGKEASLEGGLLKQDIVELEGLVKRFEVYVK